MRRAIEDLQSKIGVHRLSDMVDICVYGKSASRIASVFRRLCLPPARYLTNEKAQWVFLEVVKKIPTKSPVQKLSFFNMMLELDSVSLICAAIILARKHGITLGQNDQKERVIAL